MTAATIRSAAPRAGPLTRSRRTRRLRGLVAPPLTPVVVLILAGSGCAPDGDRQAVESALEGHFGTPRPVEPRLSALPGHAPCEEPAPLCRRRAAADASGSPADLLDAAARLRSGDSGGADRLVLGATLELAYSVASGNGVDASISLLKEAVEREPGSREAWSDLAAFYLVRSRITDSPGDAIQAIEVAERALEADPDFAPARFNLALAMERFGLGRTAERAWRAYAALDEGSAWSAEAETRARRLAAGRPAPTTDALAATRSPGVAATAASADGTASERAAWPDSGAVERLVASDRQRARLLVQDSLLPGWARASLRGDGTAAQRALALAGHGGRLLTVSGGDQSPAMQVAEIRGAADGSAARRLARAHLEYGEGRRAYAEGSYDAATRHFAEAEAALPTSGAPVLSGWIDFYTAATLMYGGRMDEARDRLAGVLSRTASGPLPALAGRAQWGLGSIDQRAGRFAAARDHFQRAAARFEAAGELENFGATRYLTAETGIALGQSWTAMDSVALTIATLNESGATVWLHNLLYSAAEHARALGLGRAAHALQDEGVAVAADLGNPLYHAESLLARSRLRFRSGTPATAAEDLAAADSLFETLDDPRARAWIATDRSHTAALLQLHERPAAAADALEDVASFFGGVGSVPRQATALLDHAHALHQAGDLAAYRGVLARVLRIGEEQVRAAPEVRLRASLAMTVRDALIRAVDHDLDTADPASALAALTRWSGMRSAGDSPSVPPARSRRAGVVELSYLLLDDGIAVWVDDGATLRALRVPVRPETIQGLIASVNRAGRRGAGEEAFRPPLTRLFELLIAPALDDRHGFPSALRIYAEGPLAGVPFAALYDGRSGEYLVQKAAIAHAPTPTAAVAGGAADPPSPASRRVLVVAADSFDTRRSGLPRLPMARAEARAVSAAYGGAEALVGREATSTALRRIAANTDVLHFAGHAVLSAERPWSSHLVLAPDSTSPEGELEVPEMIRAFGDLSVVVLASCRSATPNDELAEGFTGLADALMAAGVETAIGAVWEVGDADAAAVVVPFHRQLADGVSPTGALRAAQLEMIGSTVPRHRSPASWGAFRAMVR